MKYEIAIFDLDGTLLNTLDDLADSLNYALSSCKFPTHSKKKIESFLGNGVKNLIACSLPKNFKQEEHQQVYETFREHYTRHCIDKTLPYDNIIPALLELKNKGVTLALISNKANSQVQILNKHFFGDIFTKAYGQRNDIPRKPDATAINLLLEELNLPKSKAVYIGDSEVDIETAKNAEIPCIACQWGFRTRQELLDAGALSIVSDSNEMLEKLLK